jgi:hypothetical protein
VRRLMLEKELAATSSWSARHKAFKRHHGVDLRRCAEHHRLEGAVEVRNAIAHGLGRLTTRQLMSSETVKHLSKVDVPIRNGYVALERHHLEDCGDYTRAYLVSVDRSVP